ncbi:MAG: NADH-ubiquinone oxidoreductase-F iron-sulfur binding region domain-containing protein [Planctomycetaceae bacterium]
MVRRYRAIDVGKVVAIGFLFPTRPHRRGRHCRPDFLEQTSICGLGQVALHSVLSMLQHFPNELPPAK